MSHDQLVQLILLLLRTIRVPTEKWTNAYRQLPIGISRRMDRWMGLVAILSIAWLRSVVEDALSERTPALVAQLILNQRREIDLVRKDVRLRARITDETLHVQFLGHFHGLFTRHAQLSTG